MKRTDRPERGGPQGTPDISDIQNLIYGLDSQTAGWYGLLMETIDRITADQVQVGDYVVIEGLYTGEVLSSDDLGDSILVTLSDEEEYGDPTVIRLDPSDWLDLLGY